MNERLKKLREKLSEKSIKAVLIKNKFDREYLLGFKSSSGYILLTLDKCFYILNKKYTLDAKKQCLNIDIVDDDKEPISKISEILKSLGINEVSLNSDEFLVSEYLKLRSKTNILFCENLIRDIRSVKDSNEINKIRKACMITDEIYEEVLKFIKANQNLKEVDVKNFIEKEMLKRNVENSFRIIVASGINGAKPHGRPTEKRLKKGELVTIDFGVVYEGYRSDITRTFALGEIRNQELLKIYDTVYKAQEKGVNAVFNGILIEKLDLICREYIKNKGYDKYFVHGTGHGIGLEGHECFEIKSGINKSIFNNSVFTIEPGIYIEGVGGVRIEDTVLVVDGIGERLTKSKRELIML